MSPDAYPEELSAQAKRDVEFKPEFESLFAENVEFTVLRQMLRDGFGVARCTIERLMAGLGLHGVVRGELIRTDSTIVCC